MKRLAIISIVIAAGLFGVPNLFAQENSVDDSAQQAVASCQRAQQYIENIQKPRDLRGRVDRLQAYRYIYQRLDVFVIRLERNNQHNAKGLRSSLDALNDQITTFKDDYEKYDQARNAVVEVDSCQKNNTTFVEALQNARQKRDAVHADILALDATLSPEVKTQLDDLHQHFVDKNYKKGRLND